MCVAECSARDSSWLALEIATRRVKDSERGPQRFSLRPVTFADRAAQLGADPWRYIGRQRQAGRYFSGRTRKREKHTSPRVHIYGGSDTVAR